MTHDQQGEYDHGGKYQFSFHTVEEQRGPHRYRNFLHLGRWDGHVHGRQQLARLRHPERRRTGGNSGPTQRSPAVAAQATLTTSALALGDHAITAVYAGNSNLSGSTSAAITQKVQDFQFVINGSNSTDTATPVLTQTVVLGQTATYTFQVSPSSGTTFPAAITLELTGLPASYAHAITPSTLAAGSGTQTVTLTIQTTATAALHSTGHGMPGGAALGLLLPLLGRLWRRRGAPAQRIALLALLVLVFVIGLAGCGDGGFADRMPQTYTLQLNGTSGSLQHFTTFSLTVR